jgi:phospholipid transport system substrate-binding protein
MLRVRPNGSRAKTIRDLIIGCLLVAALAAGASNRVNAADPQAGAKASAFVGSLAEEAIAALTASGVSREQRESRARDLLSRYFAVDTIGRWVLGRFWQQATPKERTEYLSLFEDLIVTTYVDRFSRYSGEKLEVKRAVTDEASGDVLVFSEITRPSGGQPVEVGWRVRERDGAMKIIDVYVEGVSLGQTQRSEFASVIRNSGGKVSGLLDEMRRRIKRQA